MTFGFEKAICYSGYRDGQSPKDDSYPTYQQVYEDLLIIAKNWRQIRLYDCSHHAETVLQVIRDKELNLKVMLGAGLLAEKNNPQCQWNITYDEATLLANRYENNLEIHRLIKLANRYKDIVNALSIGNEATADWSENLVDTAKLISYARRVKMHAGQPVTYCESYIPWKWKLGELVDELDFISLHSYPVWDNREIDSALKYTRNHYYDLVYHYLEKPVIITEAGWTTSSDNKRIKAMTANQEHQARYYRELLSWCRSENILTFIFEAFDEPWKGTQDPSEPEKHWGLFTADRKPKLVMQALYDEYASGESAGVESVSENQVPVRQQ